MSQKKLLFVINHMDWFWSHRLPLAMGAQNAGWDVSICASDADQDEKLEQSGFKGIHLSSSPLKIITDIKRIIREEKPDLMHVITLKYAFLAGIASRFYKDIQIVHTIAGLGYLFSGEGFKPKLLRTLIGPFLKFALRHPNVQIIFQNPDDMDLMIKRGFVDEACVHLIRGSGVDLEQFQHAQDPQNEKPVIVMPTRLVRNKGVAVFIEAAKIAAQNGVDAKFQIAGGAVTNNPLGIRDDEMKAMIKDTPVEWLGRVSDMPALYTSANLIVYPSYYGEGVPKVLLEAAATGRAIITTDHPGCREAVENEKTGLLVPIKDAQKTAEAIQTLIADTTKRIAMGNAARKFAEKEYDVNGVVDKTLSVYESNERL